MKGIIFNNLYLSVDFQERKTEEGERVVNFYLVGALPVVIDFKNGEKQIAKLKIPEPINSADPELRNVMGKRADEIYKTKRIYRPAIKNLAKRLNEAINKANLSKMWNGKEINDVSIIKMETDESRKTS